MLASLLLALVSAAPADDVADNIAEFQRFYKGRASVAEKIEAIHVLDHADRLDAVQALVECFDDPDFAVRQTAVEVIGNYRSAECSQFLIDEIVANKHEPNAARKATAVETLARMGHALAAVPIADLLADKDDELRRACARALGALRAKEAAPKLLKLLADRDPTVRIAALDALGPIAEPSTNAAILDCLKDDRWQVKAAAIGALAAVRQKESVQPLIELLRAETGRLREDVQRALLSLTTFDLGTDADRWQTAWDRVKDRFVVPTEAELKKAREAFEKTQQRYKPGSDDFAGVPTKSKRILYVIDISGSMEDPLMNREKFVLQGRTYSSFVKMEVVKDELTRTISNLDDTVFFNVLAFATEVKPWKKQGLVQANILNRSNAVDWIKKLQPIGGASQSLKRSAGLTLSSGGALGKTNFWDSLMTALEAKSSQKGYDTDLGSPVDTIFFLSDGDPTAGPVTETDRILAEVKRVNTLKKIAINTINIGKNDKGKVLMRALAEQNGGTFLDLGE